MGMHDVEDESTGTGASYAPVATSESDDIATREDTMNSTASAQPLISLSGAQQQKQRHVSIVLGNPFSKRIARLLDSSDAVATRVLTDAERR